MTKFAEPVKGMKWAQYPLGDVTQWFGENPKLYMDAMGLKAHNGIDIVRPHGEHMYAVEDGIVCAVKLDAGGHGKHFRLISNATDERGYHRDWVYGHMSLIGVKDGQEVKAGQFVGLMGNTGFVVSGNTPYWEINPYAGTHLHLGVRYLKALKRGGWTYTGCPTRWEAVDYGNGYKGRVDFIDLFLPPELLSSRIIKLASVKQSKSYYQVGVTLQKLNK